MNEKKVLEAWDIIDSPICENDANAKTIREYLKTLLRELWDKGESFSSKRPFGNSSWDLELCIILAKLGAVEAEFDEDDCLSRISDEERQKAYNLIFDCIALL